MSHKRKAYTSDLSENQWLKIKKLLPLGKQGAGRPIEIDMREAINAMFYVLKTGCQWGNLPHELPNYQSVTIITINGAKMGLGIASIGH